MAGETVLVISGDGMPPYAVRGITQTLEPIDAATNQRRTINAQQINLGLAIFRKYRTTISCTDWQPPAFDNVWPGDTLTIHSVKEFSYLTAGGAPQRAVVPGSSRVEGAYTFYRPIFTMMVERKSEEAEEYTSENPWTIELQEV